MNQPIIENVRDGAREAWETTGGVASGVKVSVLDRMDQVARVARAVRAFGLDDMLLRVGLQRRRTPYYALAGAFGAGALVGAGVALAVTPVTGSGLRAYVMTNVKRVVGKVAAPAVAFSKTEDHVGERFDVTGQAARVDAQIAREGQAARDTAARGEEAARDAAGRPRNGNLKS